MHHSPAGSEGAINLFTSTLRHSHSSNASPSPPSQDFNGSEEDDAPAPRGDAGGKRALLLGDFVEQTFVAELENGAVQPPPRCGQNDPQDSKS